MYDLLLKGGELIDPGSGRRGQFDVAFADGKVAAIEPRIDPTAATRTIPAAGLMVTPGLIDMHVHAMEGIGASVTPDADCLPRGSTTVVDGGTAGARIFKAFRIMASRSRTRVLSWLHLSTIGQVDNVAGEMLYLNHVNPDAAVATARANPDLIVGFKARVSTYVTGGTCRPMMRLLRQAADEAGLPVMIHIGDSGESMPEIFPYLRAGDVVSHILTGRKHGIMLSDGKIIPEAFEARRRGIIFDMARGRNHLAFPVLRAAVEQDLLPDTISTDLTDKTAADPYFGVPMVGTHLLAMGVSLERIIEGMTIAPAKAIRRPELGRLEVGGNGDATLLRLEERAVTLRDSDDRELRCPQRLIATGAVRAGEYTPGQEA